MRFYEIDCVFCVLSFASAKERYQRKAARETFLARKVSRDSSKERRGIFAFEAIMLHTHENLHNAPPTERRGLFGCSWPANYRHGHLCVVGIFSCAPTDGAADRGDPEDLCHTPLATQSLYPNSVPKPQKQKPPRKVRACADARGERSKK